MGQALPIKKSAPDGRSLKGVKAQFLREALDASAIVVVTDAQGVIIDCNRKFQDVSGYDREELIGCTHRKVNSGVHEKAFFTDLYRTIRSGSTWRGTICNRRKDGSLYWVDTTILPTMGPDGRPTAFVAIRVEVTDHVLAVQQLAAANAEAERATKLRDRFLANMSHEVRTPLNGILGLTAALMHADLRPEEREKVDLIMSSGQTLRRVLDDILDLSKIQAGELRIVEQDFNPAEEISAAAELMRSLAEEKGLALSLHLDRRLPDLIRGDPVRLRQIVSNLVSNAVKFTQKGTVSVHVRVRGPKSSPRLGLLVLDTGPGFDRQMAQLLFRPFFQTDDSHTRVSGGTGLGLSISRELATMMSGRLQARARPGAGALFLLSLPLTPSSGTEQPRQKSLNQTGGLPQKILLVEDNLINQKVVQALLAPFDIEIDISQNGQEGVEMWQAGQYDLVLMDMQMPVMDGLTATRRIREIEAQNGAPRAPVIMLTANASETHRDQAHRSGADLVVAKPFTPAELLMALSAQA